MIKSRARLEILNFVASMCLPIALKDGTAYARSSRYWWTPTDMPLVGDLVSLGCMSTHKWYLGWVHGATAGRDTFEHKYLIESIEDGELCEWSNITPHHLNRETVRENPRWRWTDEQFAFYDRWHKVCYHEHGAYVYRPLVPEFASDRDDDPFGVALGVRMSHGMNDLQTRHWENDYREVSDERLGEIYLAGCKEHEAYNAALKAKREAQT